MKTEFHLRPGLPPLFHAAAARVCQAACCEDGDDPGPRELLRGGDFGTTGQSLLPLDAFWVCNVKA